MPLLEGLDGKQKMSKSLGNYIGVDDAPNDMYGKVMSVPDELITRYMRLASDIERQRVDEIEKGLAAGDNPRDAKRVLAESVVGRFHGADAATAAAAAFARQFQQGQVPDEVEERQADSSWKSVADALVGLGLATSKSEARRLAAGRGVRRNGEIVEDGDAPFEARDGDLWQVGKRRFLRIRGR
jgi:tyrosyl-tRNA synthetase